MNGRQAARAAAKRIEELETYKKFAMWDIQKYNECVLHMINKGSPCDYCDDLENCKEKGFDVTLGCDEWILGDKGKFVDE